MADTPAAATTTPADPAAAATLAVPVAIPVVADPAQTRLIKEFKHTQPLYSCRFDPAGKYVFSGAQDYLVSRWTIEDGTRLEMPGHQSWVRAMAVQSQAETLWTGDCAGLLHAWRYNSETPAVPARAIPAHQGWIRAVAVNGDGSLVATAGNDNVVRIWNSADGTLNKELKGHESHVYNVLFHPTAVRLVSVDLKGKLKDWDLATGSVVRDLHAPALHKYDDTFKADIGGSRGMAFSPDGKWLTCSGITNVSSAFAGVGNPVISVWDWEAGTQKELFKPKTEVQGVAHAVRYHSDGFFVGAGGIASGAGVLWFWKPDAPVAFHEVTVPSNTRDLALSADGLRLALASWDATLHIYEMTPPPAAT